MKKKILAAMLAALAVGAMVLTGCSFGSADPAESSSAAENSEVVSSETSSEDVVSDVTSSEITVDNDGKGFNFAFLIPVIAAIVIVAVVVVLIIKKKK